jgi:nucleotide-binding universal stress UspA family protein
MFQRILLAVDPTPLPQRSLDTVTTLAQKFDSTVHVLHIATTAPVGTAVMPLEDEKEAQQVLDEALAALRGAGVNAEGELLGEFITEVAPAITAAAERVGADLLVLSPHHRGTLAAWFNPRVSDAVSHATHAPVLLLPETDEA